MIRSVLLVARSNCRHRWAGLGAVALVVAVFSAASLVALVGAQRTATSVERFRDWADSSDVEFQTESVDGAVSLRRALDDQPAVRGTALRYLANAFPIGDGEPLPDIAVLSDPGGEYGVSVDRMRMIDGRMPDPNSPREVVMNEAAARLLSAEPGDVLPVQTFGVSDLELLNSSSEFPGFNGPVVDLEVVGIGRSPRDLPGELRRTDLIALASSSFLEAYAVGAWPPVVVTRLAGGEGDLAEVTAVAEEPLGEDRAEAAGGYRASQVTAADEYLDATQRSVDGLATGLLVFVTVVVAAGALAMAQMAGRLARLSKRTDETLATLGMQRPARTVAMALPVFGAALVGVSVGSAAAVALSPVLPTGRARMAEIDPGVWIGLPVLAGGVVSLVVLVAAVAMLSAARATRRDTGRPIRARATLASRIVTTFGLSAVVATGLRRASPDRRAGSAPARSAMIGMAVAIAGVLAAGVVVSSADSLESDPANWGWTWTTRPDAFGDGDPMEALLEEADVSSAGLLSTGSVVLDGGVFQGMSLDSAKGDLAFTLLDGRLPSSAAEVALGRQTMHDLGLTLGDEVQVDSADGEGSSTLEVVGVAVLPPTEAATLDEGAVFTPDGLVRVAQGEATPDVVISYGDGADVAALEQRLAENAGFSFPVFARARVPGSIDTATQSVAVAWALALFFLVIGVIGLLNALTTSVLRDGRDFAVLRALGMRGRQVREATLVQALALSVVGLLAGVPLGLIAGRAVWRALSGGLGIAADPQVPWLLIWFVIPATALVAALSCWWPGRVAARTQPAVLLRAE